MVTHGYLRVNPKVHWRSLEIKDTRSSKHFPVELQGHRQSVIESDHVAETSKDKKLGSPHAQRYTL